MRIVIAGQVDGDPREDRFVEPLALLAHGLAVEPAGVAEQQEHEFKVLAHHSHVLLAGRDQAIGIMYLGQHCRLAHLQVFHRNDFVEVGIDQLLLLAFQLYQALSLVGEQGLVLLLAGVELHAAELTHLLNGLFGELHLRAPDALDFFLDFLHRDIRQVAVCAASVPAEAEEVAVDATFASAVGVAHPSAAAVADQRTLPTLRAPCGLCLSAPCSLCFCARKLSLRTPVRVLGQYSNTCRHPPRDRKIKVLKFQVAGASGGNLLEHLLLESIGAVRGGGIFAWANASGARTLLEDPVMDDLLVGGDFRLVVGTDTITDSRAIEKLVEIAAHRPRLQVNAFMSPPASLFHPKLAWFEHPDHVSLIVGSGNLTMGGLLANWEAFTVSILRGVDASDALRTIQTFLTDQTARLLPISDARVAERAAANDGNERDIRSTRRAPAPAAISVAAAPGDDVLVAEIPRSDNRWSQANFDRANYEGFFGARVGSQRRIVLQNVNPSGHLGDIESRPSVEVVSQNYRFELSAAKGKTYPTTGAPIGVFVRLSTGQFLYSLLLPGDAGYLETNSFLGREWAGSSRLKRRVNTTVDDLRAAWPMSPLWTVALPDL